MVNRIHWKIIFLLVKESELRFECIMALVSDYRNASRILLEKIYFVHCKEMMMISELMHNEIGNDLFFTAR